MRCGHPASVRYHMDFVRTKIAIFLFRGEAPCEKKIKTETIRVELNFAL